MKRVLAGISPVGSIVALGLTRTPFVSLSTGSGGGAGCFFGSAATVLGILTGDPILAIGGFIAATSFC